MKPEEAWDKSYEYGHKDGAASRQAEVDAERQGNERYFERAEAAEAERDELRTKLTEALKTADYNLCCTSKAIAEKNAAEDRLAEQYEIHKKVELDYMRALSSAEARLAIATRALREMAIRQYDGIEMLYMVNEALAAIADAGEETK